jgi:hypothetical protein
MQNNQIYRQGDILIVPISEIPKAAKRAKAKHRRLVLAEGEATGHHHSIADSNAVDLLQLPSQDDLFLLVKEGNALLEHQEHATITIPPGTYRIVRQREYSPEAIRRVQD